MKYQLSNNTWDDKELAAIQRVIDSNMYSMGKEVQAFEVAFAAKIGVKYAVMSNSGSSANLLAIAALIYSGNLKSGDEVIVPAVSWSTTYFPLSQFNLKLRFVDIDKYTLNMDIERLEDAITSSTKAIFAVNLLGNPNNYTRIQKICETHGLLLIEDNCEALGGSFEGRQLGTFGKLGTYSTFYSHHICTMEGGVTVTNDEILYHHLLCIRAHGWTRNLPHDSPIYKKNNDEFYESFNFIMPGFNVRPLEIEGAIGLEQLNKLDDILIKRRANAEYFLKKVSSFSGIRPQSEVGTSSWFGFALILEKAIGTGRSVILKKLKQAGIEVRPIVAGNFIRNKAIDFLDYDVHSHLYNADDIHENGFMVGNHSRSNIQEIDYLFSVLEGELK